MDGALSGIYDGASESNPLWVNRACTDSALTN